MQKQRHGWHSGDAAGIGIRTAHHSEIGSFAGTRLDVHAVHANRRRPQKAKPDGILGRLHLDRNDRRIDAFGLQNGMDALERRSAVRTVVEAEKLDSHAGPVRYQMYSFSLGQSVASGTRKPRQIMIGMSLSYGIAYFSECTRARTLETNKR